MAGLYEVERAQRRQEIEGTRSMLRGLRTLFMLWIVLWIVVAAIGFMAQVSGSADRHDGERPAHYEGHR